MGFVESSTGRLSEGARTESSGSEKDCISPHAEGQGKAATSVNWMHVSKLLDVTMQSFVIYSVFRRLEHMTCVGCNQPVPKYA